MKVSVLAVGLALTTSLSTAWTPSSQQQQQQSTEVSRRNMLGRSLFTLVTATTMGNSPAFAGLLDEYGSDPSKIQQIVQPVESFGAGGPKKEQSVIEPNLRSNYYYPTNKKRYLPRIKRCSDAIPEAAAAIGTEDWDTVETFALKIADDTVLPMRLYTSSLTGGGTNVKVSYTKDMNKCADDFEKNQKKLVAALKKKDREASSAALEGMATALQTYRTVGRLLGPDGGGDIPSVSVMHLLALLPLFILFWAPAHSLTCYCTVALYRAGGRHSAVGMSSARTYFFQNGFGA